MEFLTLWKYFWSLTVDYFESKSWTWKFHNKVFFVKDFRYPMWMDLVNTMPVAGYWSGFMLHHPNAAVTLRSRSWTSNFCVSFQDSISFVHVYESS